MNDIMLFIAITLTATFTPGPAVLFVIAHSIEHGWQKALVPILGNITGLFFMALMSVAGLSLIIASDERVFWWLKTAGAAYLIYLGWKLWRGGFVAPLASLANNSEYDKTEPRYAYGKAYVKGLAVALSNPKAIMFTSALLPQFIDMEKQLVWQFSQLVVLLMVLSFLTLALYAICAHGLQAVLSRSSTEGSRWGAKAYNSMSKIFGAGFVGFGVWIFSLHREVMS